MKMQTSRFGTLDVADEMVLRFPSGLVGFPACRRFVVLEAGENSDYQWIQSVDESQLAFVIVEVRLLQPEFHLDVPDEALAELDMQETDPITILAVVTIPSGEPGQATANLRAPLVVNLRTRKGKQIILHESIPLRYQLVPSHPACPSQREGMKEPASV